MKQLLVKILKIALIVTLVLLAVLIIFGIVLSLDWPWWVGVFILLGLVGFGIGVLLLKRFLVRRQEQQFVGQIVAQDASYLKSLDKKQSEGLQDVQDRWKEAIEALRRSHLRKYGNPLYVLPWYMVIGESGSGKTTAIESARLSSPFAEVNRTSGISGTKNCDWWFFEQAIIIDTAGRYAIPIDEGRDRDEWQRFLNLLAKYRKKEPLNGLVVSIAADRLLETRNEALEEDGRSIRSRVDELMRVLGAKFPVYVLITKCDLVQGMTQFCDQLPEKRVDQAMGLINHELSTDVTAFTRQTTHNLGERLRDLRLLLLQKPGTQGVDPALLLFPEEFERLEPGLAAFVKGAFYENPYQETPLLRGIFFSSGRQEGSPYSHFLKALDLIGDKEILPGTNKGLFLHDFFARIMPEDRRLFAPTQRAIEWTRLTRNLGLASYVAIVLAICGLLSFSFVKNLRALREASSGFTDPPILQGKVLDDLVTMGRFQQTILKVSERNRNWWIPRFWLHESEEVEGELKNKYCDQFRGGFLEPFDKKMASTMADFSSATEDEMIARYVTHVVRRINLLKARLQGEKLDALRTRPQPSYEPVVMQADQTILSDVQDMFGGLYLYYLAWRSDTNQVNQEMIELQKWLAHILTGQKQDMHWLVAWANGQKELSPVSLEEFWGGTVLSAEQIRVAPAFTLDGKQMIDSFVLELESALPDPGPPMIAGQKMEFQAWYHKKYLESWYSFASDFTRGVERLEGREAWQQMGTRVAAGQGPYWSLLDRMADELEPAVEEGEVPPWVEPVFQFQEIKAQAAVAASGKGLGALAKVTRKGRRLADKMSRAKRKIDKIEGAERRAESEMVVVQAYLDHKSSLAEIAPVSNSRKLAFQLASQVFSEDEATGKSPFFTAHQAVVKLKAYMGSGEATQEVFGKLAAGPQNFLWSFVRMEAGCQLQQQWEQEVVAEVQGSPDWQQLVLGQDGYGWKFIKGPAAPFIARDVRKGYYGRKALGGQIPFEASFFSFLQKGARATSTAREDYSVRITGLPTGANSGARLPHLTRLELQCGGEMQSLSNLNYPISKSFNWSPADCGDVLFTIEVGNVTLTKSYTGYMAFASFLYDFRKGTRTFYPREFPEQKAALNRMGIKYITVTYQFRGHSPVLKLFQTGPGTLPRNIVTCWDQ